MVPRKTRCERGKAMHLISYFSLLIWGVCERLSVGTPLPPVAQAAVKQFPLSASQSIDFVHGKFEYP